MARTPTEKAKRSVSATGILVVCEKDQVTIDDTGVTMQITVKTDSGLDSGPQVFYAFNAAASVIKNAVRDAAKAHVLAEEGTAIANANISYMNLPTS